MIKEIDIKPIIDWFRFYVLNIHERIHTSYIWLKTALKYPGCLSEKIRIRIKCGDKTLYWFKLGWHRYFIVLWKGFWFNYYKQPSQSFSFLPPASLPYKYVHTTWEDALKALIDPSYQEAFYKDIRDKFDHPEKYT